MRLQTAIKRAAARLVKAEVAYSWRGAGPPEDIPELTRKVKLARRRFNEAVARVDMPKDEP